MKIKGY